MAKCQICGSELIEFKDISDITTYFNPETTMLTSDYKHSYTYCPKCAIIDDFPFTIEQLDYLKANSDELVKVAKKDVFSEIDPRQVAKSCLVAAANFELIGDTVGLIIANQAVIDILGTLLLKHIVNGPIDYDNVNPTLLNLSPEDYNLFMQVEETLNNCRRVIADNVTGELISHEPILCYILLQTYLDLGEVDSAIKLFNLVKDVYGKINDTHKKTLNYFQSRIDKIKNLQ